MREATGTSSIIKIVLAFTFLFAGFLSVAITYNKNIRLKNESLKIIEKYEGIYRAEGETDYKTLRILNNYLKENGYNTKGKCDPEEYGAADLINNDLESANKNNKADYFYCVSPKVENGKIKYNIKLFFKFNLPFFGDLTTFNITGETKSIIYFDKTQELNF